MGSKTRSLGLSSLVVTSLDKGAYEELSTNGWTVPDNPVKMQPPTLGSSSSYVVSASLKSGIGVSLSDISSSGDKKLARMKLDIDLSIRTGVIKKLSNTGWRRKWSRRLLTLDRESLSLSKTDSSKAPYKSIKLRDIVRIEENRGGDDRPDDGFGFTVVYQKPSKENNITETENWCLSVSTQSECSEWRASIATRVLIMEIVKDNPGQQIGKAISTKLLHLVSDCGVNLEFQVMDRTSLLLLAAWYQRKEILSILLRKGVDPRPLLRLDGRTRSAISPGEIVDLLELTGRDLNLIADDLTQDSFSRSLSTLSLNDESQEGGWSLLHYFVVRRDVEAIGRLLQRIDRPTLNLQTLGGDTALTLAVKKVSEDDEKEQGSRKVREIVRLLLEHGADPNVCCATGDSPFHIVCKRSGKLSPQISLLFEASSQLDLNLKDAYGDAPLHILLKLSQMTAAKRLANDSRANLDLSDCHGDPLLILAMKLNEESFACFLISKNADGSAKSNQKQDEIHFRQARSSKAQENQSTSEYPIHLAIKMHMTSLALKLVERLSVEKLTVPDNSGRNGLLLAILHSLLGVAHAIVTKLGQTAFKQHLNYKDVQTGDTAIDLAVRAGRVELTNALLDAGADIGERNVRGETAIHVCARFVERTYSSAGGYTALKLFAKMIEMDARRGAASCINVATLPVTEVPATMRVAAERCAKGCRGRLGAQPVVHQAAACENEQCGLWLLDALFKSPVLSLESMDGAQYTALAAAIEARNTEICRLLVSRCAISRLVGNSKESYLHLVMKQIALPIPDAEKLVPIIESLLAYGTYAGHWDAEGNTPLHIACSHPRFLSALKVLLKDRDLLAHRLNDRTEFSGLTPLMVAVRLSKSAEVVGAVIEAGADFRLLEPRTRHGVFQMCTEPGFDSLPENQAICVRVVHLIRDDQLAEGDDEWRARKILAEKHSSLIQIAQNLEEQGVLPRSQQMADVPPAQVQSHELVTNSSEYSLASNPILKCNERLALGSKSSSSFIPRSKRLLEHKEEEEAPKDHIVGAGGKKSSVKVEFDQKQDSDNELSAIASEVGEQDGENSDSDTEQEDTGELSFSNRLSQLDRIIAFEHYRVQALETAHAWLESDNGKKMIAQVANVLISENSESMSMEAAVELAKRNFLEEHVKESLAEFHSKFPPPRTGVDEKQLTS